MTRNTWHDRHFHRMEPAHLRPFVIHEDPPLLFSQFLLGFGLFVGFLAFVILVFA